MVATRRRRRFGYVRKLPSGRWQASFIGPNQRRQNAPETFRTRTDADRWLVTVEAEISKGVWLDSALGRQTFREYAEAYLRDNPDIGPRWAETCTRNMRLHMVELLDKPLIGITGPVVRRWHAAALAGTGGRTSIAQSYRFGRAVMNQAKRDNAIPTNPFNIRGAGSDKAKERPIASPVEVADVVETITPRYRAAVLLAAWCGLRRGEICGLATADLDLTNNEVWVRRNRVELLESPEQFDKEPKTDAGKRPVSIPPHLRPYLVDHLEQWAGKEWLFVGRDGNRMRGNAIYQAFVRARDRVGVKVSFHDLRHTGQTLAAATGATLADLKKRLGHSSNAAAARYLHAVDGRDREIAEALSKLAARGNAVDLPRSIVVKH
ncbi:tyrosine-type recombinase/integrase [Nocardia niwae]|uniref:tyrosine-type recombinase/integrase n=1 Tax=Nocardia niwae TaxID=626084 RepID=UPI0007A4C10B|nr:site-specific integrase [Nocardia niwae]